MRYLKNLLVISVFFIVFSACSSYPSVKMRMAAALEQAELVYSGCDLSVETDTIVFIPGLADAAGYYARKKMFDKAALAALYNGYSEKDYDKEMTMNSFKDAERYGAMVHDSLTVARASYHTGMLLYDEGRKTDALASFKNALSFIGSRPAELAVVENSLATVYILSNQLDSAEICLQNSLLHAQDRYSEIEWKIFNNYAVLYRIQRKYDQALDCLRSVLEKPYLDDTKKALVFLNLGNTFMALNELDSAARYFQRLDTILQVTDIKEETRVSAYASLLKFAKIRGDNASMVDYYEEHESALYAVMSKRQEHVVYRIQRQYDYEALRNTMSQRAAQNQRIVAIVLVILLCIIVLALFSSARANKREAQANANLFHFMQQNKALVESNMTHKTDALNTAQRLSDVLYARLNAMQKLDYCLKTPIDKGALKDLEQEVFGSVDHWKAIEEVLCELYPGLLESLKLKYPEMEEMELRVCMLSRLKLSRQGEATLLGISTSVLDKLRTKVRKIMKQD